MLRKADWKSLAAIGWGVAVIATWLGSMAFTEAASTNLADIQEAYFNGSAYIRLVNPVSLLRHTGLSFRTCTGGELFSQQQQSNYITVEVKPQGLRFRASVQNKEFQTLLKATLLNNRWYYVELKYELGNLTLSVAGQTQVIANNTFNQKLLFPGMFNESAVLLVGKLFNGCIAGGPSMLFSGGTMLNTHLGKCPISMKTCEVLPELLHPKEDFCANEPCLRHGTCRSLDESYECICFDRYTGKNCDRDLGPPCSRMPPVCQNGGSCKEGLLGDYYCACPPKFSGQNCEKEISSDPMCDSLDCQNNSTCRNMGLQVYCDCLPGFTGTRCDVAVNECATNPCLNGGHCTTTGNHYVCNCQGTGYKGKLCEENVDECMTRPCLHNGVCFDYYGGYSCHCPTGYGGHNCELNLNECISNPCLNRGHCIDKIGGFECKCLPGYSGEFCEKEQVDCATISCPPYSECHETSTGAHCQCKQEHFGVFPDCYPGPNCRKDTCMNGGECPNFLEGGKNCSCPVGYRGNFCEQPDACLALWCRNGGTCVESNLSFHCLCSDNFFGPNCENHLRCENAPCAHATACQDFTGGYYCSCEPGWTGTNCDVDINECSSSPCRNEATCTDLIHDFVCSCAPGYTGAFCEYRVDECASLHCLNGGTCVVVDNKFQCNCTENYGGQFCEKPLNICETFPCRNNGTCVLGESVNDYICKCNTGYDRIHCALTSDCAAISCPEYKTCFATSNGYSCRCPDGYSGKNCTGLGETCGSKRCEHGEPCIDLGDKKYCQCSSYYKGTHCETDVDECAENPILCKNGLCVNKNPGFQCYCLPGFSGELCDVDFDECLSQPCRNGATCLNQVNNFTCICTPGFAGKDCSRDINECESNPCADGSTCIDGIASFNCVCQPGLTGERCETNIDDCASSPCQSGGICIDGLNNYTCDCNDTGFTGGHCETNIDDCLSNPCQNGAGCEDGIKNYTCNCYPGYAGHNCEEDIDECASNPCKNSGTCLQRSDRKLYQSTLSSLMNSTLPDLFQQEFSYENASGFECICLPGVTGKDCSFNINECESSPCFPGGGVCVDKIGGYVCDCDEGFEGVHCDIDIDECAKYKPCVHGKCIDQKANYFCSCEPEYGGKNCSVKLTGCSDNPCKNNGTCKPYLENEIVHKFNCTCPYGFHGQTCETITTMSFAGDSYVTVNRSRDEGYDMQFRFKTTLGNGLLAVGEGFTFTVLQLNHGRLNLRSSLLNKWEGVFIGSNLNDSKWQKVFVAVNTTHVVMAANDEQTIYPITLYETFTNSHTSFPMTYLGGTVNSLISFTKETQPFVGCMEDIIVNNEWILPDFNNSWTSVVGHVDIGCPREPQCDPNPCHSGGHCTDLWRAFNCTCERPFLGNTCQYNFTAATFGYENITNSLVMVQAYDKARRAVRSIVDISMFIRTRQSKGQIFYLGSELSKNPSNDTYISAQLENGELVVRIQINGQPEHYSVGGVKLDNGNNHLIEVIRNVTLVQVKLNHTEYFRKTISAMGSLDAQVLYLGGFPQTIRYVRQAEATMAETTQPPLPVTTPLSNVNFKGIIQDVQISNGSHRMVVEFFPLIVSEKIPPLISFGNVTFDITKVLEGSRSDDACRANPCSNNGTCVVTWNDYVCECPLGYKGKNCLDKEFCQLEDCPVSSLCRNLEDGFECISNVTLDGKEKPLVYSLNASTDVTFSTVEINYKTAFGGTVMFVERAKDYFLVFARNRDAVLQWELDGKVNTYSFQSSSEEDKGWTTIVVSVEREGELVAGLKDSFKEERPEVRQENFRSDLFSRLFSEGNIYLGGSRAKSIELLDYHDKHLAYNSTAYVTADAPLDVHNSLELPTQTVTTLRPELDRPVVDNFKGCLGEIRVGNYLLPYFRMETIYSSDYAVKEYFHLISSDDYSHECRLCFETDCLNGGDCGDPENEYSCRCPAGYSKDNCSEDIDECELNDCQNMSTCIDMVANYTCTCAPGYQGWLCDQEIDECLSSPCRNGGTCIDLLAKYECRCPDEYSGLQCEALKLITCENQPCFIGSTCTDELNAQTNNNFTCHCPSGMVGAICDTAFCVVQPCLHGNCSATYEPSCQCERGFSGKFCEENVDDCVLPSGSSPCQHSGICIDGIDKYTCNCTGTGYVGLICEIDEDECELDPFICGSKGGTCENTDGSYICRCPFGLCGRGCAYSDPCTHNNPCGEYGNCTALCGKSPNFRCDCLTGFAGQYCNQTVLAAKNEDDGFNIALIVVPIVSILLIVLIAGLAVLIAMARSKRATRGTYSPSAQEFCNPRVELDHVLKPPPEERLI